MDITKKHTRWMAITIMINEKQFAKYYNSFWANILPMSNVFVKKINTVSQRFNEYIESDILPKRRAFINQVSFNIFYEAHKRNLFIGRDFPKLEDIREFEEKAKLQLRYYAKKENLITDSLSNTESHEVIFFAKSIQDFTIYNTNYPNIVINPKFKGCGFINHCYGDIFAQDTLYEIKITNDNFKAKDLRQILIYCSLNYLSKDYPVNNVGFYNPRMGKYFECEINEFTRLCSGKSSDQLFSEIIDFVSNTTISR